MDTKFLIIIPARGGSKGIPKKNIKLFNGKPLICHTIDIARAIRDDANICVSTDNDEIISLVENYGLKVPFKRPDELATDTAITNDVLLHAIDFYESNNVFYNGIILLQPTSPLRTINNLREALSLYTKNIDMVVSVKESHLPSVLCKDNENGFLDLLINKEFSRRQDVKSYYEINGAIYIINVKSLKEKGLSMFDRKIKYIMSEEESIDIDNYLDWEIAEYLSKRNNKINYLTTNETN